MDKHTPTPWKMTRSKLPTDGEYDYAISADGAPVLAEVFGRTSDGGHPPAFENAQFIVKAVNSHASLTEAVRVLTEVLENIAQDCEADYPPSHGAIKHAARAALTTAKELTK